MSKNNVFDREWIDLVFEGRNKEYGAYKLRKDDSKTTMIAFFSGIALLGIAVGIPYMVNQFAPSTTAETPVIKGPVITPVDLLPDYDLPEPEPVHDEPIPETTPEPPAAPAPAAEPTIAYKPFVASEKPAVDLPDIEDVLSAQPAATTNPGNENGSTTSTTAGVSGGTGDEPVTTPGTGTGTDVVHAPDEKPDFPGGIKKFREEIAERFRTPDMQSASTMKVTVSFVVEKDGSITNVKVLQDPGYGAGKEAIRVLNAIKTKWKPGKVKGQPVRTAYTLPIVLKIN